MRSELLPSVRSLTREPLPASRVDELSSPIGQLAARTGSFIGCSVIAALATAGCRKADRSAGFVGRFEIGMPVRHTNRDATVSAAKERRYVRFNNREVHTPVPITELVQQNFGLFIPSKERTNGQEAQAQS
jgi:hypothetical protein